MMGDAGETRDVTVRGTQSLAAIMPQTFEELEKYCERFAQSAFCPKDYKGKSGEIMIAMQMGAEVGLRPLQAVQSIAVINGRPSIWGDGALALVRSAKEGGHPLLEDFDEQLIEDGEYEAAPDPSKPKDKEKYPNIVAICRAKRRGQETVIERRFSFYDAMRAKLWGKEGPWTNYPKRMCQMRARSWVLRDGFADVLKGLHIREEVEDIETTAVEIGQPTAISATAEATVSKAAELKEKYKLPAIEARPTGADAAKAVEPEVVKDDTSKDDAKAKAKAKQQPADTTADNVRDASEREPGAEG